LRKEIQNDIGKIILRDMSRSIPPLNEKDKILSVYFGDSPSDNYHILLEFGATRGRIMDQLMALVRLLDESRGKN
jgi:hypothetical protein